MGFAIRTLDSVDTLLQTILLFNVDTADFKGHIWRNKIDSQDRRRGNSQTSTCKWYTFINNLIESSILILIEYSNASHNNSRYLECPISRTVLIASQKRFQIWAGEESSREITLTSTVLDTSRHNADRNQPVASLDHQQGKEAYDFASSCSSLGKSHCFGNTAIRIRLDIDPVYFLRCPLSWDGHRLLHGVSGTRNLTLSLARSSSWMTCNAMT